MARPLPYGHGNPLLEAAFFGCVTWLWEQPEAHAQFQTETGTAPIPPAKSPLEILIDEATGAAGYATAFIEWVIRTHWGEEES